VSRRRHARAALHGGLALLLGLAAAVLVSCGSSSGKGLIPVAQSEPLQADFEEVSRAASAGNGNCSATNTALEKTAHDFASLPSSVNSDLMSHLRQGIEALHSQALAQCSQTSTNTTPTTATTNTQTTTVPTTPTQTTTTPTTPTQTETTTTPQTTTTTPGGGTEPPSEDNGDGGGASGGVPPGQEGKPPKEGR
jgi:hypothetical protein